MGKYIKKIIASLFIFVILIWNIDMINANAYVSEVPELNAMVKEVNETQVERQEQLSDKVQFCDGKTAVMENAERRETRLEKAKEAEKVTAKTEAKGGIHGKLEKAKAEIKAKGADTIPKDKAKDLATVL